MKLFNKILINNIFNVISITCDAKFDTFGDIQVYLMHLLYIKFLTPPFYIVEKLIDSFLEWRASEDIG